MAGEESRIGSRAVDAGARAEAGAGAGGEAESRSISTKYSHCNESLFTTSLFM
jgi:hypothetical protein